MSKYTKCLLISLSILISPTLGLSQVLKGKLYEIKNYTSKEYKQHPQNWSAIQAPNKILYFANNNGVLEYDGNSWRLIALPNRSSITSLNVNKAGNILVGAESEFGYLAKDSISNKISYISLTPQIKKAEKEKISIRKVFSIGDLDIFQTAFSFYIFKEGKFENKVSSKTPMSFASKVGNRIYATNSNEELICLENNNLKIVSNLSENFKTVVRFMLEFSKNEFLIGTKEGIYIYNFKDNTYKPFSKSISNFIAENTLYCGMRISKNEFALGTLQGGLIIVDNEGDILSNYNTKNGLQSQTVHAIDKDLYGNLWLSMGDGISQLIYNSSLSYYNSKTGLKGISESIISKNNKVYVGTTAGVFQQQNDFSFKILKGSKGECWKLMKVDNDILCSHKQGLFQIDDNKFKPVSQDKNSWTFIELKNNKNLKSDEKHIISGSNSGLSLITKGNNGWSLKYHIKGFSEMCRWVQEDQQGNIWVSEEYKGIYKLTLNEKLDSVITKEHFTDKQGLPSLEYNYLFKIKQGEYANKLVLGTNTGVFAVDSKKNELKPVSDLNKYIDAKDWTYGFASDFDNNIYMQNGDNLFVLEYQKKNSYIPYSRPFKKFSGVLIEAIIPISKTEVTFATKDGITIYNPKFKNKYSHSFPTHIRKITIADSAVYEGYGKIKNQTISYDKNKILIKFASPYFQASKEIMYSYQLKGYSDEWSPWSKKSEQEFTNMLEGEYTFNIKAKNIFGDESKKDAFTFTISPPWFRTYTAYALYIIIILGILYILMKLYTRKLKNDKVVLEQIVQERTSEIMTKNTELEQQKEEILAQTELLEDINKELEKLSIVASETDNAIVIMNEKAEFEWINEGFTKLYGYRFAEFKAKYNDMFSVSSNAEIKGIINKCIQQKKTFIYESVTETTQGNKIWVQTTLTPILDSAGNIRKIIAIDADIRKLKQIEQELQVTNEHITSSITYAKTIQTGILPLGEMVDKHFENFILFRPKDIVSGDFYWYINTKNYHFVAAVDCTGHGVPGAFMSMIGSSLLNQIVYNENEYNTANILTKLNELVIFSLRQEKTENNDGMDVSLCRIEKLNGSANIQFTGAKRPLLYIKAGQTKLEKLKGDRKSIGGTQKKRSSGGFTSQEINLDSNSTIYLSTDGFVDQNNAERKKYGTLKLIEKIESISNTNMKNQHDVLNTEIENWMKGTKQRDDITILGLRL